MRTYLLEKIERRASKRARTPTSILNEKAVYLVPPECFVIFDSKNGGLIIKQNFEALNNFWRQIGHRQAGSDYRLDNTEAGFIFFSPFIWSSKWVCNLRSPIINWTSWASRWSDKSEPGRRSLFMFNKHRFHLAFQCSMQAPDSAHRPSVDSKLLNQKTLWPGP